MTNAVNLVRELVWMARSSRPGQMIFQPEDLMKNDRQIQQEVLAELDRDRNITQDAIGVEVHHGVVKLSGRVDDYAIKRYAELAARRVEDVTSVVMDIDVIGGFANARSIRKIA
jgi:osmotically-inducible protein OsmY